MSSPPKIHTSFSDGIQNTLDFFGKTISIRISGKEKQSTLLGCVLGLLSVLAIIVLGTYFTINLFRRNNVNIMFNQNRDMIPENNISHTPIVFKLIDRLGKPMDNEGLYNIEVAMVSYFKHLNSDGSVEVIHSITNVTYNYCNLDKSFGEYRYMFEESPYINQLFCISPYSNNLTLYGKYSDSITGFSYLNFYVNKCTNRTGRTCLGEEEVDLKLYNVFFSLTILDHQLIHYNTTQAITKVLKTSSLAMNSALHKRYFNFIRQVFYETDFGFIFPDKQQDVIYQQDNSELDISLPDKNSMSLSNFGTVSLVNENKIDFYYRSFDKLQSIVANTGGMIKGILTLGSILNYLFTRNYSLLKIVNSIFDYEDEEENFILNSHSKYNLQTNTYSNKNISHVSTNLNMININNDNKLINNKKFLYLKPPNNIIANSVINNTIPIPSHGVNEKNEIIPNFMLKNMIHNFQRIEPTNKENLQENNQQTFTKLLKLSCCSLIFPKILSCQKKKRKILDNSEKIIDENISVHYIIEKFFEVEKLKSIVLKDEPTLKEFDNVAKPLYKLEYERILNQNNKL